mmetsp:Transcript_54658/g.97191  ORF Transcript_54658/g.97191 Transcript_54658/m.97191 type:complete len:89 (-) Transcript_54658:1364-1630(-)
MAPLLILCMGDIHDAIISGLDHAVNEQEEAITKENLVTAKLASTKANLANLESLRHELLQQVQAQGQTFADKEAHTSKLSFSSNIKCI